MSRPRVDYSQRIIATLVNFARDYPGVFTSMSRIGKAALTGGATAQWAVLQPTLDDLIAQGLVERIETVGSPLYRWVGPVPAVEVLHV